MSKRNGAYQVSIPVPNEYPDEKKRYLLRSARRELVDSLLDNIHNERWYAICIKEYWPHSWEKESYDTPWNPPTYRMSIEVKEIEIRVDLFPRPDPIGYSDMSWWRLSWSAIGEIKRRWQRWNRENRLAKSAKQVDKEKEEFRG